MDIDNEPSGLAAVAGSSDQEIAQLESYTVRHDGRNVEIPAEEIDKYLQLGLNAQDLTGKWGSEKEDLLAQASRYDDFISALNTDPAGVLSSMADKFGLSVGRMIQDNQGNYHMDISQPSGYTLGDMKQGQDEAESEVGQLRAQIAELSQAMSMMVNHTATDVTRSKLATEFGATPEQVDEVLSELQARGLPLENADLVFQAIQAKGGSSSDKKHFVVGNSKGGAKWRPNNQNNQHVPVKTRPGDVNRIAELFNQGGNN